MKVKMNELEKCACVETSIESALDGMNEQRVNGKHLHHRQTTRGRDQSQLNQVTERLVVVVVVVAVCAKQE